MPKNSFTSHVHCRKAPNKTMPAHIQRGNLTKSRQRANVEHVFSYQKQPMSLAIPTVGAARAKIKIKLANITYNIHRLSQLQRIRTT